MYHTPASAGDRVCAPSARGLGHLLRAAGEGTLTVDACNAVSLHSGLPISVVELDRVREPLRIALDGACAKYRDLLERAGAQLEQVAV